jgi:hypothetical protein
MGRHGPHGDEQPSHEPSYEPSHEKRSPLTWASVKAFFGAATVQSRKSRAHESVRVHRDPVSGPVGPESHAGSGSESADAIGRFAASLSADGDNEVGEVPPIRWCLLVGSRRQEPGITSVDTQNQLRQLSTDGAYGSDGQILRN